MKVYASLNGVELKMDPKESTHRKILFNPGYFWNLNYKNEVGWKCSTTEFTSIYSSLVQDRFILLSRLVVSQYQQNPELFLRLMSKK